LSTPYAVAVTTRARDAEHARSFAAWLSGEKTVALRTQGGFEI
jgi:hypothetical protein